MEGRDVQLPHTDRSRTRKDQALLFISTFLYSYTHFEAVSTTPQCKRALSYLQEGGLHPKMARASQVSSLLSAHCVPSPPPVFPVHVRLISLTTRDHAQHRAAFQRTGDLGCHPSKYLDRTSEYPHVKKSNIRKKYLKLPSWSNFVPAPAAFCSLMAGEHSGREENC